jgi:uncharacterized membrane protein
MISFPAGAASAVALFAIYAFFGWIIEVIYRSWTQRRFVNAGFLFGPFVPLYGMGALLVLALGSLLASYHPLLLLTAIGIVLTVLEYLFGYLSEKFFGLKLWDYSENRFNLHGRVCLFFSIVWAVLAYCFALVVHPAVKGILERADGVHLGYFSAAFLAYYTADLAVSTASVLGFRKKIALLLSNYVNLSNAELDRMFGSFQRLLRAFPNLNRYLDTNLREHLKSRVDGILKTVSARIEEEIRERKPRDREYFDLVKDILANNEFQRLKDFFHHNSSIYEHARKVSYLSYRISKYLNLDYRAAARGGLLHDFFLYDWRDHDEPDLARGKFHGLHHPRIALENAERHFAVSGIEKDIILKHMWPLTLIPPRYRESFVVTFVDKYLSSKEFVTEFAKQAGEAVEKKRPGRRK